MFADRAMWASVAVVDCLRNGVPLENAHASHVARSLAAVMHAFRLPLDEYWERQMVLTDGSNMMILMCHAGFVGLGPPAELEDNYEAISAALSDRSWESLRKLPDSVWRLLRIATGMTRDEWEGLPEFCRDLLSAKIICPDCLHSGSMDTFGEPNPIDDPTYFSQQRLRVVFRCPKCGTEITYSITSGRTREYHAQIFGDRRWVKWAIVGTFLGLSILTIAFFLYGRTPHF